MTTADDFLACWAASDPADTPPALPPFRIADHPPPAHTHLLFWRGPAVGWQDGSYSPGGAQPAVLLSGGQRIPLTFYTHWRYQPPAPEEL